MHCLHMMRTGSSPLARGLQSTARRGRRPEGIIPARAGFTSNGSPPPSPPTDHPRSRGVYQAHYLRDVCESGSSPLARGLHKPHHRLRLSSVDHPRSRGVYSELGRVVIHVEGSSPLARGLRNPVQVPAASRRIIPARAGFTFSRRCETLLASDHPRSRGVYAFA